MYKMHNIKCEESSILKTDFKKIKYVKITEFHETLFLNQFLIGFYSKIYGNLGYGFFFIFFITLGWVNRGTQPPTLIQPSNDHKLNL